MVAERKFVAMTGTPLTKPDDAYAYISLINPDAYLSKKWFDAKHVKSRDFFNNILEYKNEGELNENFLFNSARVFRRDVDKYLPDVIFKPIFYELEKSHKEAYDNLAENALFKYGNEKINGNTVQKLHIMLQQIIVGYESFFEDEKSKQEARKKVKAFELIEQIMSELDGRKLVIFAYYQNTIRALKDFCKPWNAVEIYGKLTAKTKMKNLNQFLQEDDCKILIGQPLSMGSGLDGIKKVCTDILFVELPMIPKELIQAIGRIDRNGQTETCRVRLACAKGTVQVRRQDILLAKDVLANRIQYSYKDLRDWLFGA